MSLPRVLLLTLGTVTGKPASPAVIGKWLKDKDTDSRLNRDLNFQLATYWLRKSRGGETGQ